LAAKIAVGAFSSAYSHSMAAIRLSLVVTIPAGYALARFPIPFKEVVFVFLLLGLIIPYQALLIHPQPARG
jgi:multiple sugar transport system permease protein